MEKKPEGKPTSTHILIFPLPMQGPVNAMLNLAQLLLLSSDLHDDLHVTFLTTDVVHRNLHRSAGAQARSDRHPRFSFLTFSDNLPENHPRGGDKFEEMLDAVKDASGPVIEKMVSSPENTPVMTCIVCDPLYDFVLEVGNVSGVPVFFFETMSPSCLWVYLCLPYLVQAGEVPFTENKDLDTLINVPGLEGFIRGRDLPHFCRALTATDHDMIRYALEQANQIQRAQGIILNTFEDFDSLSLSNIRSLCPCPIYTIGPLHLGLKERLQRNSINSSYHSNSFFVEDRSCVSWLDKQPPNSVIYCSFGSQVVITKNQLMEFWHGLVESGVSFLWVKRPKSVIDMEDDDLEVLAKDGSINRDLIEGIDKRGFIVSWVPQVDILSHPSVGGFLTHSGWNSTIESVVAGVPMICWPRYVDQLVISRFVSQVWKIGVDMKDVCDRAIVAKIVKDVMVFRREELLENVNEFAKLSMKSVQEGGSSFGSLKSLVEDIRGFHVKIGNCKKIYTTSNCF